MDKNYYTAVDIHEPTNSKCVRLNLLIGLRKNFFREYILKFDVKYNGENI